MSLASTAVVMRFADGAYHPLALDRWKSEPTGEELEILEEVVSPVLDIGCGPGRHVVELAGRGAIVLGIDTSPAAVALTRERGGPALERSVFGTVPGAGRWMTALLMDGNVGIGGDPEVLLRRVAALLAPRGRAIVEIDQPGVATRSVRARLEHGDESSVWFPWAIVGADRIGVLAGLAGFEHDGTVEKGGRWFATLSR